MEEEATPSIFFDEDSGRHYKGSTVVDCFFMDGSTLYLDEDEGNNNDL